MIERIAALLLLFTSQLSWGAHYQSVVFATPNEHLDGHTSIEKLPHVVNPPNNQDKTTQTPSHEYQATEPKNTTRVPSIQYGPQNNNDASDTHSTY